MTNHNDRLGQLANVASVLALWTTILMWAVSLAKG